MGLMDEVKRLFRPYEEEDEEYDDEVEEELPEEEESAPVKRPARRETARETRSAREPARETPEPARSYQSSYRSSYDAPSRRSDNVVSINATTRIKVVLMKPEKYENASDIADRLRDKQPVVLNLEAADKDTTRRLLDFLSGAAYAMEGSVKRVSAATYLITPYNVELVGDLVEELESSGLYF